MDDGCEFLKFFHCLRSEDRTLESPRSIVALGCDGSAREVCPMLAHIETSLPFSASI